MERKYIKCDSFIFYASFFEAIKKLPESNQLELYNAIFEYGLNGIEPQLEGVNDAIFDLIRPQLKANRTRYENGCKGGAPVGNSNARKQPKNNQDTTESEREKQPKNNQKQPNENVNENDNENVNEGVKGAPAREEAFDGVIGFEPPTLEEVKAFVKARELEHVDAERFYNWFAASGWYRGRTRIIDWQAEALNWEKREITEGRNRMPQKRAPSSKNLEEREYSEKQFRDAIVSIDDISDDDL